MSTNSKYVLMSATRLNSYLTCKWKYWCNYVLHLPRKSNVSFKLGIAAHDTLAFAGKIWKKNEIFTENDLQEIYNEYNQLAAREGLADTSIYNSGLEMVKRRLKNFANGLILTIEDKFRVTTDEGIILIGAMDKVEELSEETLLVVDYKTSKYFETTDELRSDLQLSMYDAVASLKYPKYKRIILSLDYLRGESVYTYRTADERKNFLNYLTAIHEQMLNLKEKDATPILNPLCNWCDFTDNCEAYKKAFTNEEGLKKNLQTYSNDDLVKNYLDIKNKKRILDNREKEIRQFILKKIDTTGEDMLGDGKCLYIRQNSSVAYNPMDIFNHMPIEEFLKIVSISKKNLDTYLNKNPTNRNKILASGNRNYKAPFVAYRAVK